MHAFSLERGFWDEERSDQYSILNSPILIRRDSRSAAEHVVLQSAILIGGDMNSQQTISNVWRASAITAIAVVFTAAAQAQVPPDIAAQLWAIGTGVCVPETAKIYRPLQPKAPYPEVTVMRDISYAPDPRTIMDVFAPEKGGGSRPVLIYVSGGGGDKLVSGPDGDAFYDNIMLWAVKNGMTGVNMQRRGGLGGGGLAWDEPAKDVGRVVEWVRTNITKYKGNPNRIFLWADSAGNGPVSTYAAHPEIHGTNGAAVKGIILMSSPNFNILPETVPATPRGAPGDAAARGGFGTNCGRPAGEGRGGPPRGAAGGAGRGGG